MEDFFELYESVWYRDISGRYITPDHLRQLLSRFNTEVIGQSVRGEQIPMVTLGRGGTKILIWSQMHGNEGTTTKALADFLNGASLGHFDDMLSRVTLKIVPILNPDGARDYTRANAKAVDLNRDFVDFTQPESRALQQVYDAFKPDYCFNMHDQRTIFGAGDTARPATLSFLAPAYDPERNVNDVRMRAMYVITVMNRSLQEYIPGGVGRFDDSFNRNCAGDAFTALGSATILFEAGHYPDDYQREITRKFVFNALLAAIACISSNDVVQDRTMEYLTIPQNKICFYDFVYKNVKINYDSTELITNFAVQYRETLSGSNIEFIAEIASVGNTGEFGHVEFDGEGAMFTSDVPGPPIVGAPANFSIGDTVFRNGGPVF